eukprot:364795-Chlamydomonas_euryale.AAC.15
MNGNRARVSVPMLWQAAWTHKIDAACVVVTNYTACPFSELGSWRSGLFSCTCADVLDRKRRTAVMDILFPFFQANGLADDDVDSDVVRSKLVAMKAV